LFGAGLQPRIKMNQADFEIFEWYLSHLFAFFLNQSSFDPGGCRFHLGQCCLQPILCSAQQRCIDCLISALTEESSL
jgi:hypothetical protein